MENYKLKKKQFLKVYLKLEETIRKFGDIKIEKQNFTNIKDFFQ